MGLQVRCGCALAAAVVLRPRAYHAQIAVARHMGRHTGSPNQEVHHFSVDGRADAGSSDPVKAPGHQCVAPFQGRNHCALLALWVLSWREGVCPDFVLEGGHGFEA